MIARPQADLLNMLPVTQVTPLAANALGAGSNTLRFDVALLEAAKTMRDSAPQAPELTLVPKVRQAFESALAELSQKPLDQLKTLAQQPQAARPETASIVSRAAQAAGLNAEETAALQDLVPLALPRLIALKTANQVPGLPVENLKNDGVQPGPQGGTPVKTADPADPIQRLENDNRPALPAPATADEQDTLSTENPLSALNQALPSPVLVSSRTDDGSSDQGALTLTRSQTEPGTPRVQAASTPAPAQPQTPGRVITVSTQAPLQPENVPAAVLPAPTVTPVATAPSTAPIATASSKAPVAQAPVPAAPNAPASAPVDPPSSAPTAQAPLPQSPKGQAPVQIVTSTSTAPTEAPATPDLDIQFQNPSKPIAVVAGSEITLQEDGTWVQPGSDKALAARALQSATAPQPAPAPLAPAPSVAPLVQSAPSAPIAGPMVATGTASAPETAPAPAANPAPVQSPVAGTLPAPIETPAPKAPAPVVKTSSVDREAPVNETADTAPFETSAPVQRRSAPDSAFSGLAQFGQDPLKALAQQTARDYAVRESVFKQVSQALREAPDTDSGRMLIRLKPAELGEVHVDLIMNGGKLSARLVASQGEVRDAFVRDLPAFKAGLESQGVVVREISVAVRADVAGQHQQQQPQQQAAQSWWRELPREELDPLNSVPASAGYAAVAPETDQRFSAVA